MLNDQQIIEQGSQAETLLSSDAFTKTVRGLLDNYVSVFFSTEPLQTDERQAAFFGARAMNEIINTLNQQVSMKDQILQSKE